MSASATGGAEGGSTPSPDPSRTLELLWRAVEPPAAPARGPRPALTVDAIVTAGIELADAEGLASLSMRKVAAHLKSSAMSLYTYVPGKTELLDLMVDTVCGELLPADVAQGDESQGDENQRDKSQAEEGWRAGLERMATDHWVLYQRHRWLPSALSASRPVLGPNVTAGYERALETLEGIGLSDVEMDSVVVMVTDHVQAAARRANEAEAARAASGQSELEWWEANAPLLEKVFDPARFPLSVRVGAAAGEAHGAAYSPEHAFAFGLARLLDGVEVLLAGRGSAENPGP